MVQFPSVSAMVLTSLLFSATSQAVTTTYTTELSFLAALPGPATTTTPTSRAPSPVNNDIELVTGAGSASNVDVVDVMFGDGRTGDIFPVYALNLREGKCNIFLKCRDILGRI
jgi:hypothetical protein